MKAKDGCVESMHGKGIEWPEAFECSQYPSIKDPNVVCLPEPEKHSRINENNNYEQKQQKPSDFNQQNDNIKTYSLTPQERNFFKLQNSELLNDDQIYEYEEDYVEEKGDTFLISASTPTTEPVNDDQHDGKCEQVSENSFFLLILKP